MNKVVMSNVNHAYVYNPKYQTMFVKCVESCFEHESFIDLVFICENNVPVRTHKVMLASVSKFIKSILLLCRDDIAYISLPGINHKDMRAMLNILYAGNSNVNVDKFKNIATLLGIDFNGSTVQWTQSVFASSVNRKKIAVINGKRKSELSRKNAPSTKVTSNIQQSTSSDNTKAEHLELTTKSVNQTNSTIKSGEDSASLNEKEDEFTSSVTSNIQQSTSSVNTKAEHVKLTTTNSVNQTNSTVKSGEDSASLNEKEDEFTSSPPVPEPFDTPMEVILDSDSIEIEEVVNTSYCVDLDAEIYDDEEERIRNKVDDFIEKQEKILGRDWKRPDYPPKVKPPSKNYVKLPSVADPGPVFTCHYCAITFSGQEFLDKHYKCCRKNYDKPFHCEKCGKTFTYKECIYRHKCGARKQFKCDICDRTFTVRNSLATHMREKHSEESQEICCDICGLTFKYLRCLNIHRKIHSKERPYKCDQCGKTFAHTNSLRLHLKRHSGDRPFKCHICSYEFTQLGNLQRHMSRKHIVR